MEKGNNAATENRDRYYMQQALIEAQTAYERGEIPVGAVIVHKDRVIARSHNLTETLNDVTAHAEMQAITAAADVLGGRSGSRCFRVCSGKISRIDLKTDQHTNDRNWCRRRM